MNKGTRDKTFDCTNYKKIKYFIHVQELANGWCMAIGKHHLFTNNKTEGQIVIMQGECKFYEFMLRAWDLSKTKWS